LPERVEYCPMKNYRLFTLRIATLCTGFWLLLGSLQAGAAPVTVPTPPTLNASAWLLMDYQSGRVLAKHNSNERIEPASLTKMMTAYAVLHAIADGSISLQDEVRISEKAWKMKGSRMFIEVNKLVSVEDLLKGMIIQSGNDASVALAEHVAGSEDGFVQLMNQYAMALGMKGTHFTNSTGWPDDDHYTTAHDLAILSRALIEEFPEHYAWYKVKEYTYNSIRQFNRNRLLWLDDRVDGIKTGHTESAGYCLVTSAKEDEMRLISVVVGTKSDKARATASRKLLNYGFRFYETFLLHAANKPMKEMRIWKGAKEMLPLGTAEDLYITIPRGQRNKVKANMTIETTLIAPAQKGQPYGTVNVMLGDTEIASRPLIALESIPEGSLWRRLVDTIKLKFQ
jgi:serine-type D-Ala-D-Ala carboxypeptidase (penicillin-binding protein 5/6)